MFTTQISVELGFNYLAENLENELGWELSEDECLALLEKYFDWTELYSRAVLDAILDNGWLTARDVYYVWDEYEDYRQTRIKLPLDQRRRSLRFDS